MDRGSLRALKIYTNFGYSLGFSPYKFVILPSSKEQQQQQQQEKPNIKSQNWIENQDKDDEEKDEETKGISSLFSSVVKKIGSWLYNRNPWTWKKSSGNSEAEPVIREWKFVGGSRGKGSWWLLLFSIGLQGIYQLFLIFRSIQAFLDEEQSPKEKVKIFYLSGILFILNFAQILLVLNYGEHDTYLNAVKNTVFSIEKLQEKESRFRGQENMEISGRGPNSTSKSKSKSIKAFIYATLTLSLFVPLIRGSNVFRNPRSKLLITSLFSDTPEKLPVLVKLVAAAFHFHVAGFSAFVGMFLGVTLVWYVAAVLPIISYSRLQIENWSKNEKNKKRCESKVSEEFIYSSYNRLSILQNNFKTVYGSVALLCELGSLYVIVLNIFLTVVHSNLPSLARVLGMIYLQKIFFSRLAEIHTASEGAIDSWKRNGNGNSNANLNSNANWFKKFTASVRPLRISVGDFFYVDKTFMLTLMSITISQTVNLILLG